jgi:hypothetical protein
MLLLFTVPSARADWVVMPESREHLYRTYANFVDENNMLAWRGYNRYWATVGGDLPIVGDDDSSWHPQFVLHLSGNDSMHINDGGGVFTETLDTRLGLDAQFAVPQLWDIRFSIGVQHESGHTVDGTDNPELNILDLGDNTFRFQAYRDFDDTFRLGVLVAPVINSIPTDYPALAYVMGDYFPLGSTEDGHAFKPYISSSLGHRVGTTGHLTFQLQGGVAMGSHFHEHHTHVFRIAAGFYQGADPRSKYAQYDYLRTSFGYLGIMYEL